MNFTRDVVAAAPADARALVELDPRRHPPRVDVRRADRRRRAPRRRLHARGRRDAATSILTLVGNRPEWAITMLACFRQGYVVLPCTEQLRPKDLALRLQVAQPRLVVADSRNAATLLDAGWSGDTLWVPFEDALAPRPRRPRSSRPQRPVPDHVHVRHRGRAEGRPARPALPDRPAAAGRALARAASPATSCGARPPRAGASRPATRSSRPGCAAPPRCCTTRASIRTSASSSSTASRSTCCAWRRPSTA